MMARALCRPRPRVPWCSSAVLAALLLTLLPAGSLAVASEPVPTVREAQLRAHLQELDGALEERLERLERLPAAELPDGAEHRADAERLRRHLTALAAMIRLAAPPAAVELQATIRRLERRVADLEYWPATSAAAADTDGEGLRLPEPWITPLPGGPVQGAPANDVCADAQPIGAGTFAGSLVDATVDGRSGCDSSASPDVWYRASSPTSDARYAVVTSTDFYPVLSQHTACPGPESYEIACRRASPAEPSAYLELPIGAGESLLRISARAGLVGDFSIAIGAGGEISGTVTDAATGDPIPQIVVLTLASDGSFFRSAATGADGSYTVSDLAPTTYSVFIYIGLGYVPEVYAETPCERHCDQTVGTPVTVALGEAVAGIDFALDLGGSVTGTVRREGSGEPLAGVQIQLADAAGDVVDYTVTDGEGRYTIDGLAAATYFAGAFSTSYRDEVYDDLPCYAGEPCHLAAGTPLAVSLGNTTAGVDFALTPLGAVSGTVTDATTGEPLPFIHVDVFHHDGTYATSASTDSDGVYTAGGLEPGVYYARTYDFASRYAAEVYDDLLCAPGCDPTAGTPITVNAPENVAGVDFALRRLGVIAGAVTASATGAPLAGIAVTARDAAGNQLGWSQVGADGSYRLEGLYPGAYFVTTDSHSNALSGYLYLDELYDDLPCPRQECTLASGTPVGADLDEVTADVDFALAAAPKITGRVTAMTGGAPLAGYRVQLYDEQGTLLSTVFTDAPGGYTFYPGAAGSYFVATSGFFSPDASQPRYRDELYDGLPCPQPQGCDPTAGTPIAVGPGTDAAGVDFALVQLGAISGRVTNALFGGEVPEYTISLWGPAGEFVLSRTFYATETYYLNGLDPGTYYVIAYSLGYLDELFPDLPCEDGFIPSCDPTAGTAITVELEATVAGVDFALVPLGSIAGQITDAVTGEPIPATVLVWGENGELVTNDFGSDGFYHVGSLAAGQYYVGAVPFAPEHLGELYGGLPCTWGVCDPTQGTPVTVSLGAVTSNIDFELGAGGRITGRVTNTQGQPLSVRLTVADEIGRNVTFTFSDGAGHYTLAGLATGVYSVSTDAGGYRDETSGPIAVTAGETTAGVDFSLTPLTVCSPSDRVLCLNEGRFQVELEWADFDHEVGVAHGQQLTDDSGYFYFFGPDNVEVVIKVLRACFGPNPRYWVFAGGLTNLEVAMTVTDTATGQSRRYDNPLGTAFELVRDTGTFTSCGTGLAEAAAPPDELARAAFAELADVLAGSGGGAVSSVEKLGTCTLDAATLCLGDGRFAVTADWASATTPPDPASAEPLTADTGYFTFLDPDNVEVVIKVLDACGLDPFHNFWVFAAGLTDLEVELRVTDTVSGEEQVYTNALGDAFVPVQDTGHFAVCP